MRANLEGGDNAYQAAIKAGYPPTTAHSHSSAMAREFRSEYVRALRAQGCDEAFRARKTLKLLEAKAPKWNSKTGRFELFENADVQLRTLQEVNRIAGEYPAAKEPGDDRPVEVIFPASFSSVTVRATHGEDRGSE